MTRMTAGLVLGLSLLALTACNDHQDVDTGTSRSDAKPIATHLQITQAGRFQVSPFAFDESAAEIASYDARLHRLFVVNSSARTVDVLDVSDPNNITLMATIDASAEGASANSVSVDGRTLAVAIEADNTQAPGKVVFYDTTDFSKLGEAQVGALPDMVTFTPDGRHVLTANEGEPSDDYQTDPEGSVSLIDVSNGFGQPSVATISFSQYNDQADSLRQQGIRIFGPNATVAQDLEPEYIAVSADSQQAYVSLQENNAIAVLDLTQATVTRLLPLGYKDHSMSGQGIDPSNSDGFNVRTVPVFGMYQPDTIDVFEADDTRYIMTANEGDARDYDGFSEEADVKDLTLDAAAFPDAATLQTDSQLGDLQVTTTLGDIDGDGDYDALYAFGARSFSIRRADTGALVYDSGDDFEQITGARYGDGFNANNTKNTGDNRSDNKGPEPEALATGVIGSHRYAFIGLERMSGFMVYDISDVHHPQFVDYINNRDLHVDPASGQAGDLAPESIVFIPASNSPTDEALLSVSNEVSGSTTLYHLQPVDDAGVH